MAILILVVARSFARGDIAVKNPLQRVE